MVKIWHSIQIMLQTEIDFLNRNNVKVTERADGAPEARYRNGGAKVERKYVALRADIDKVQRDVE